MNDCCRIGYKLFRDETWFMNRYISTIARTEFPALLTLTQVHEQNQGVERSDGFMRLPGVGAFRLSAPNGIGL